MMSIGFVVHFEAKSVKIKAVIEKSSTTSEIRKPILVEIVEYSLRILLKKV
jgi:hypothetical protein